MTTDHPLTVDDPAATTVDDLTVGDLQRDLEARHTRAAADTARLLQSVTVDVVRANVADKIHTVATRVANNGKRLTTNRPGDALDDRDPLAGVLRDLRELIALYGVAEVLHGRVSRRATGRGVRP
jgi:hypothetical protein